MAWSRPTLQELVDRIRGDFKGRLEVDGAIVRRSMANIMATVWAGAAHALHGHIEWLAEQLFATTANREFLLRRGRIYGMRPTPAEFATGTVTATGDDGEVIDEGETLVRDDGFTYTVTSSATISGGDADLALEADEAGEDGNLDAGETLEFESPISGVDPGVTVDSDGITGGADEESTEAFRERLKLRLSEPPQGGAEQDYEAWALEVSGVTRAWVFPHEEGLGTVVVRFVMDDRDDIFPESGDVEAVQEVLDENRPVTDEATAKAPVEKQVDFDIELTPDDSGTRAAVEAELDDLFFRDAEPGDGEGRGTILLSQMRTAIGIAEGVEDYQLNSPDDDETPDTGELIVRGSMTWS